MKYFKVTKTDTGNYRITGVSGYQLILSNRFDAERHCNYLNRREEYCRKLKKQNIGYNVRLKQIWDLVEQLQMECGYELRVLDLAIRIKRLIRELL